ncbi:hypothetical protein HOY82DRAFT_641110 [Tuber indicum]|nr:hypothetical protein HOY82DRAFT_641110 [Tuber indicum]
MSKPTEFIFPASVASLDEPFPEILSPRFTGATIPPAHIVSPFDVSTQYDAVDFYSRLPFDLCKTRPLAGASARKNASTKMSFNAAVKQLNRRKDRYVHLNRPRSPEPAQCKYNIVRYEFRPNLPFALQRRLWYPVEHAWQIYNYDKYYLSPVQVERLESLKRERDFALAMIRGGHPSYWKIVRNAEMGMFGDSPEFGVRPRIGRAIPLLGHRTSELHSYKSKRGRHSRLRAVDGFCSKGQTADVSVYHSPHGFSQKVESDFFSRTSHNGHGRGRYVHRVSQNFPVFNSQHLALPIPTSESRREGNVLRCTRVSVQCIVSTKEATSSHNVYGATLDQIVEEAIPECASIVTRLPTITKRPIRRWGVAVTRPTNPPAAQSLVAAMPEPLGLILDLGKSLERQSMDSGFAESRSMISSEVMMGTRGSIEIDPKVTRGHTNPRYIPHHSLRRVPALLSGENGGLRAPLYDLAKRNFQSAVDKAARLRRSSIDSLKMACRARRTKNTTVIFPQDIEEEEFGAPLFKPWTIGDQSTAPYRNPRKWFSMYVGPTKLWELGSEQMFG